ncbi:hypothetical protein BCCGELA001_29680 [Bradyrhizobium sp. CCGE-LA001]|nr:hypothetical protein BCCGELA001_29680 [Bradyrhizobium sp. CCGE-LA001]
MLDLHFIAAQVDAGWQRSCLARAVIERPKMLGTFDDMPIDDAIREMDFLMGAVAVDGEVVAL